MTVRQLRILVDHEAGHHQVRSDLVREVTREPTQLGAYATRQLTQVEPLRQLWLVVPLLQARRHVLPFALLAGSAPVVSVEPTAELATAAVAVGPSTAFTTAIIATVAATTIPATVVALEPATVAAAVITATSAGTTIDATRPALATPVEFTPSVVSALFALRAGVGLVLAHPTILPDRRRSSNSDASSSPLRAGRQGVTERGARRFRAQVRPVGRTTRVRACKNTREGQPGLALTGSVCLSGD
ncbi:hypothetical protein, partial [Mariniluteicoccus endophyticus]